MDSHSLHVGPEHASLRLDKFLAARLPHLTRSRLQQLIAEGHLTRDALVISDVARRVKPAEHYILRLPAPTPLSLTPLPLPLDIVFEDAHLLVVNKPVGLTVHPAAGNTTHTLVNALLHHCGASLSGIGGVMRPGIVHRIDKDTSGLLIVAKTDAAHQHLSAQLKSRALSRGYVAFAWGAPPASSGTVNAPIARHPARRKEMAIVNSGRHAVTHYETLLGFAIQDLGFSKKPVKSQKQQAIPASYAPECRMQNVESYFLATKLFCRLDTGRTHQIRVHMKHIGCPLIGDATYGLSPKSTLIIRNKAGIIAESETEKILFSLSRQALHAATLRFIHPITGAEIQCEAPLPEDLQGLEHALASLTHQGS